MNVRTAFWLSSLLGCGMAVVGILLYIDIYWFYEAFLSVTILEFVKFFLVINIIIVFTYVWDKKKELAVRLVFLGINIFIAIIAALWARVPEDQLVLVTHKWGVPICVALFSSGIITAMAARCHRELNWFLYME